MQQSVRLAVFCLSLVVLTGTVALGVSARRGGFDVNVGWPKLRYGVSTFHSTVYAYRNVPPGQSYVPDTLWYLNARADCDPAPGSVLGFGYGNIIADSGAVSPNQVAVKVPIWAVVVAATTVTAWARANWWRSQRRLRVGLCHCCGYDLRATAGRCPECGTTTRVGGPAAA